SISNASIISATATVVAMIRWSSGSLFSFTLSAVALSSEEQPAIKNIKLNIAITLIIIPFFHISLPPPDLIYYSKTKEVLCAVPQQDLKLCYNSLSLYFDVTKLRRNLNANGTEERRNNELNHTICDMFKSAVFGLLPEPLLLST